MPTELHAFAFQAEEAFLGQACKTDSPNRSERIGLSLSPGLLQGESAKTVQEGDVLHSRIVESQGAFGEGMHGIMRKIRSY